MHPTCPSVLPSQNFPYKWQDSQVVLVCSLFASNRVDFYRTDSSNTTDPSQVSLDDDQGRFRWKTEVFVDGLSKNLTLAQRTLSDNVQLQAEQSGSTDSDDYLPTFLTFRFPRGQKIAWDPEFFINENFANLISEPSEGSKKDGRGWFMVAAALLSCMATL